MDYLTGNWQKACASQIYSIPLINALFSEVNPIPVKHALKLTGFDFGLPRLPLVELTNKNKEVLEKAMKEMNLI